MRIRTIGVVMTAASIAAATQAGFTTINGPAGGELGHKAIIEGVYGGAFAASGLDFIGSGAAAGITLTRIDDFGVAGTLNLGLGGPGTGSDEVWSDGIAAASAEARYAGDAQSFGYYMGETAGTYQQLFQVTGSGLGVSGAGTYDFAGAEWRWARSLGANGPHTSKMSDNDGRDHMVTYKVDGLGNGYLTTWLLFFEDRNSGDFDYNDLVVEVRAVPTPLAGGLAATGLIGLAGMRRRRIA